MQSQERTTTKSSLIWLSAAIGVAVTAAVAYGSLAEWPLGTHADEEKKIRFILGGDPDFHNPLLMIQLGRLANAVFAYDDPEMVLGLAREVSAAFGGLLVLSTFILGRMVLSTPTALAAAIAVAVCPLVAVHATFFKEDIFLAPPMVLSIAALIATIDKPTRLRSLALGLALGATVSAKYVGAVLVPIAIIALAIAATGSLRARLESLGIVAVTVAATAIIINAPVFDGSGTFRQGFGLQFEHAAVGHDVLLPITVTFGVLHLTKSLMEGLGVPLLVIGLAGLAAPFLDRGRRMPLVIIFVVAILWYGVHEASPLKPFPDFERYMVPLAPLMLILGASTLESLFGRLTPRWAVAAAVLSILAAAGPALYSSGQILTHGRIDPRSTISKIAYTFPPGIRFDPYSTFKLPAAIERGAPNTLVTSNFAFERFYSYGGRGTQPPDVERALEFYERIFARPYLEISNGGPSYAFLNPVLRVVAVDGNIGRLQAIGETIIGTEPRLKIAVGP